MIEVVLFLTVATMAGVSTAIGPAGGVVFVTLALTLPAPAVVPVHAALQGTGSLMRYSVLRDLVDYRTVARFAAGGALGLIPAVVVLSRVELDGDWLRLGLGLMTLAPIVARSTTRDSSGANREPIVLLGLWTSFVALFVGATGSVIGSSLSRHYTDGRRRVATHTCCLGLQHGAKIVVYLAIGFSFRRFLPLIGALLIASALGTWLGKRVLFGARNDTLLAVFEIIIIGLGAYLCVRSVLSILYRSA